MLYRYLLLLILAFPSQVFANFIGYSQSIDDEGNIIVSDGNGMEWLGFETLQNSERSTVEDLLISDPYFNQWRYASQQEVDALLLDAYDNHPVNVYSYKDRLSGFDIKDARFDSHEAISADTFHSLFGGFTFKPWNYENYIAVLFGESVSGHGDIGGAITTDYFISQYFSIFDGQINWPTWEDSIRIGSYGLLDSSGNPLTPRYSHALVRKEVRELNAPLVLYLFFGFCFFIIIRNKVTRTINYTYCSRQ